MNMNKLDENDKNLIRIHSHFVSGKLKEPLKKEIDLEEVVRINNYHLKTKHRSWKMRVS